MNLLETSKALNNFPVFLEIISAITFLFVIISIYKSKMKKEGKFLSMWLFALIALAVVSPSYVFWFPHRMLFLMRLPVALLATFGIVYCISNHKVSSKKILAIIIILSIPSLVAAEIRYDKLGREDVTMYNENDINALKFLRNEPLGIMFSSPKIGTFGPSIANKRSVLFGWPTPIIVDNYSDKVMDYESFYSPNYTGDKSEILKKYNVTYVFFGEEEMKLSRSDNMNSSFLEKIYDSKTKIYLVNRQK
jgi:uncharacterized membrane protein